MILNWFYETPIWITLPVFIGLFVLVSCLIVWGLRPLVRRLVENGKEWDRALAHVIGTFGVFFGILLALVAVSVYENFAYARQTAIEEASRVGTLYRATVGLPEGVTGLDPKAGARFAPRTEYGEYLEQTAHAALAKLRLRGWRVDLVSESVTSANIAAGRAMLRTNEGRVRAFDYAVLCVGGSWVVPKGAPDVAAIETAARAASGLRA